MSSVTLQEVKPNDDIIRYFGPDGSLGIRPVMDVEPEQRGGKLKQILSPTDMGRQTAKTDTHTFVQNNAIQSPNGTLISGAQITYQLTQGQVPGLMDYLELRFILTEQGVGNCSLVNAFSQVDNIQIQSNGGGSLLQTIYGHQLLQAAMLNLSVEQSSLLNFGNSLGLSLATYQSSTVALAKSGSQQFILPIFGSSLNEQSITGIRGGPLQIVVNFAGTGVIASGTGTVSISGTPNCDVITRFNPFLDGARNMAIKNNIYVLPYVAPFTYTSPLVLQPGAQNLIAINGIPDRQFCMMSIYSVVSTSNVADAQMQFLPYGSGPASGEYLATIDIKNSGNSSLLGYQIGCDRLRGAYMAHGVGANGASMFTQAQPLYCIHFGDNTSKSLMDGTLNGGVRENGTVNVYINTPSSFNGGVAPASCTTRITFWQYYVAVQDNGEVRNSNN